MVKQILFISVLAFGMSACSTDPSAQQEGQAVETENLHTKVNPDQVLSIEIDGMVCKMGCGGSIRKELYASEGVSECEFDFQEDRKTNTAKVFFDSDAISSEEILSIISKINDSQFTVRKLECTPMKTRTGDVFYDNDEDDDKSIVQVESSGFSLPNFLDIFSSLLPK